MDVNALNNMLFSSESAVLGSINPAGDAIGKTQAKDFELPTDNDFEAAYQEAVNSAEEPDVEENIAERTHDKSNPNYRGNETSEKPEIKNENDNLDGNSKVEVNQQNGLENKPNSGTDNSATIEMSDAKLDIGSETAGDVNRVIGKTGEGTTGAEQQTVPVTAELIRDSKEALTSAQNQTDSTAVNQNVNKSIEFIPENTEQKQVQTAIESQIQSGTNQNQMSEQQILNLQTEQNTKNNQQQSLNIDGLLSKTVTEKTDIETEQQGELKEDLANSGFSQDQNFSQILNQQKPELKVDSDLNEFLANNQVSQVFASTGEDKSANQPLQNLDNNNIGLESQFDKAVSEKIQATIASSIREGKNEITINLSPPELGKVTVRLNEENGQITGLLQFSKADTKSAVEQLLPGVINNLQNSGIAVKKLDVVQTSIDNSTTYQQYKDNVAGDGSFGQRQFSHNQSSNPDLSVSGYDWVTGETNYTSDSFYSGSYIENDAMNVLV